jgi:hypothetical protein
MRNNGLPVRPAPLPARGTPLAWFAGQAPFRHNPRGCCGWERPGRFLITFGAMDHRRWGGGSGRPPERRRTQVRLCG